MVTDDIYGDYIAQKKLIKAVGDYIGKVEIIQTKCKFCGSTHLVRNGHRKGTQYWLCKHCGHGFVDNKSVLGGRYSIDVIARAVYNYYAGMSLNAISEGIRQETGDYPSDTSIYNWLLLINLGCLRAWAMSGRVRLRRVTKWRVELHDICLRLWLGVLQGIRRLQLLLVSSLHLDTPTYSLPVAVYVSPLVQSPQRELVFQKATLHRDTTQQSPSIYSGIGLGVYQGEAVVFRRMAVGGQDWVVSKLRYGDLSQLPLSVLSEVSLLLCLLRLNRTQSDLVMKGLQTKGGIELMRSYCSLADNPDMLSEVEAGDNSLAVGGKQEFPQQQNQCHLKCLECQKHHQDSRPQSNTGIGDSQR